MLTIQLLFKLLMTRIPLSFLVVFSSGFEFELLQSLCLGLGSLIHAFHLNEIMSLCFDFSQLECLLFDVEIDFII